ncbi:MAG: DUF4347 domain-containing protein, partial [Lentisphaeraceae bacterium]|nr:DUF4347 domain-containing protein [Lentisphaeraceae bacterium]
MFRNIFLKFLTALCGDIQLLKEKVSYMNRHTRRKSARELVHLGYESKGFKIDGKMIPYRRAETIVRENFRSAGKKAGNFVRQAGSKLKSYLPGSPKRPDDEDRKNKDNCETPAWSGLEQLEERILLSATIGGEADVLHSQDISPAETHQSLLDSSTNNNDFSTSVYDSLDILQFNGNHPVITEGLNVKGPAEIILSANEDLYSASYQKYVITAETATDILAKNELSIVGVDSGIENFESIVSDLPENSIYFVLDAKKDGLQQISDILAEYSNVDSLHIISHGSAGEIQLGNSTLNRSSLGEYQNDLQSWGSSLTNSDDILVYGCDVA